MADMGVSYQVVDHLRMPGHDTVHLRDIGMQRLPDRDIFRLASDERRTILTFDLDFAEIAASAGAQWPSVVLFRLTDTRVVRLVARSDNVLAIAMAALEARAIVVIDDSRIRIRELPIE